MGAVTGLRFRVRTNTLYSSWRGVEIQVDTNILTRKDPVEFHSWAESTRLQLKRGDRVELRAGVAGILRQRPENHSGGEKFEIFEKTGGNGR